MSAHLYTGLIDPLLGGARRAVAARVPPGVRVLDACCGPGALSRHLASDGREVLGVDLDRAMIEFARERASRLGLDGLCYAVGDVTALDHDDDAFDFVTISMGLHAMPHRERQAAWEELRRVGRHMVVLDYAVPLPRNAAGLLSRAIEWYAGGEHYAGFRDYLARGGLNELAGGGVGHRERVSGGAMEIAILRAPGRRSPHGGS